MSLPKRCCNADLDCALRRFETHLGDYRTLADPASYHYAANTLATLRLEAEAATDARHTLKRVERLALALHRAVREWQDATVP